MSNRNFAFSINLQQNIPSNHVIYFMAQVLGTSADYLIGKTENPAPTGYWVSLDDSPELFEIVEKYQTNDINSQKRLLAYIKELL